MGRGFALVALAVAALFSGCGGGGLSLRAASSVGVVRTVTSTPTALPRGPHSSMLICPYRKGRAPGNNALVLR